MAASNAWENMILSAVLVMVVKLAGWLRAHVACLPLGPQGECLLLSIPLHGHADFTVACVSAGTASAYMTASNAQDGLIVSAVLYAAMRRCQCGLCD